MQGHVVVQGRVNGAGAQAQGDGARISQGKLPAQENPNNPKAVRAVLKADTLLVPKRPITRELRTLETTVQQEIVTVTKLPKEIGQGEFPIVAGQAAPNRESGMPRPINEM